MTWRALLADGRVVSESPTTSPQHFLDQIVRFELIYNNAPQVVLEPLPHERVLYRRTTELSMNGDARVTVKVGLLDKSTGAHLIAELGNGPVRFSRDIVLSDVEVA